MKYHFKKHLELLVRNLENKPFPETNLRPFPVEFPQLSRRRNLSGGPVDKRYVVMPIISDSHYSADGVLEKAPTEDGGELRGVTTRASLDHLNNIVEFAKMFNVDAILHSGDITDGYSSPAKHLSDIRKAVSTLRGGVNADGVRVPAMLAKGNHDDNSLYGNKLYQRTLDTKNRQYIHKKTVTILGETIDPMIRNNAGSKVVFDEIWKSETVFSSKFKGFMNAEQYRVVDKLHVSKVSMGERQKDKVGNFDILDNVIKGVSISKAEKTAYEKIHSMKSGNRLLKNLSTVEQNHVKKLVLRGVKTKMRGSYCYLDLPNVGSKGIRVIVLDSHDIPGLTYYEDSVTKQKSADNKAKIKFRGMDFFGFGARQCEWLANVALKTTKEVVFVSHIPPAGSFLNADGGPKKHNPNPSYTDEWTIANSELVKQIIDDFVAGKSATRTTLGAINDYSKGPNPTVILTADNVQKKETPLTYYNSLGEFSYYDKLSFKKISSDNRYFKASVKTSFASQGPGTVISYNSGHSHDCRLRYDITEKYVCSRIISSYRLRASAKGGFDSYMHGTKQRYNSIQYKLGTYKEDAWFVMVVDTLEKRVFMYPFGSHMIRPDSVRHATEPERCVNPDGTINKAGITRVIESLGSDPKNSPFFIDSRQTGVFPIRRFGYGTNIKEKAILGLGDI